MKANPATIIALAILTFSAQASRAALDTTFPGPDYNPPDYGGNILNGGALRLQSGSGSSISATFTRGGTDSATFSDNLVLFIDSQPGGYGDSSTFIGEGYLGYAAAGASGSLRSLAVFGAPPGTSFGADYVLAIGPINYGGALFSIGTDGVLSLVQSIPLTPNDQLNYRNYYFNFDWASIGVTDPSARGFRFYSSYVGNYGARRLESLETVTGAAGFNNTIWFSDFDIFGIDPVPEPTNIALAIFGGLLVTGGVIKRVRRCRA